MERATSNRGRGMTLAQCSFGHLEETQICKQCLGRSADSHSCCLHHRRTFHFPTNDSLNASGIEGGCFMDAQMA